MRTAQCPAAGVAELSLIRLELLGLAEVAESASGRKVLEPRNLKISVSDPAGIKQHQPRGPGTCLALGSGRELVLDPLDGGVHGPAALVTFDPEVALPALAHVQALDDRAHEGKVADVELSGARGGDRKTYRAAQARQAALQ